MALHICKPKPRSLCNSLLVHRFSTSQNDNNANNNGNNNSFSSQQSSLNSYFSDVKASLKKPSQIQQQQQNATVSPFSRAAPSESASLEEIRNRLAEYRQRTVVPPPTGANPSSSFQEIYKRNKNSESKPGATLSFEAIRESLRKKKLNSSNSRIDSNVAANSLSLSAFKYSLKLNPQDGSTIIGGTQELPASVIGKEMKVERSGDSQAMRTEFVKMYSYVELGAKLKELRGEGWEGGFPLAELNERLMKLREMEEKESEIRNGGGWYGDLRECLVNLKMSSEEKTKKLTSQGLQALGHLSLTPEYMRHPPKEHLVEKYFHPDNMSSAEKMKIKLAKVREEFKMSESDCGSARVQVALLTSKIKHLSSVLHKKDKHSRKGLTAMVQRRKRLLKYLRRTDWDSYCFVLSKLGLRDNPDYKTKA